MDSLGFGACLADDMGLGKTVQVLAYLEKLRCGNKDARALLGFAGALLKVIRKVEPTHTFVVFDGEHENSRCEIDGDYKANRIDYSMVREEENPFSQLPDVYRALDYLDINYIETTEVLKGIGIK